MDFGELSKDLDFINKVNNTTTAIDNIEKSIKQACSITKYEDLSMEDKVKYDLFLSYSINSLYWMYLKLQGSDVSAHDGIKNEIARIREAYLRDKNLHERNTIRPVLDKGAAKRFIRHGLFDHKNLPKNKKKKFDD